MEEYLDLIQPIWIYLISIIDGLKSVAAMSTGVSGLIVIIALFLGYKKIMKAAITILILCIVVILIVPNYDTLVNILILKLSEKENIALTEEIVENIFNYVNQFKLLN